LAFYFILRNILFGQVLVQETDLDRCLVVLPLLPMLCTCCCIC